MVAPGSYRALVAVRPEYVTVPDTPFTVVVPPKVQEVEPPDAPADTAAVLEVALL